MNEEVSQEDFRKDISLKLLEQEVSSEKPWGDDVLGRHQVAESLTNLISDETGPLVIGLDGHWGTGKTFLLTRWQKDLEKKGFNAIYFNAWEDDFCDDPLVAIIGQLSGSFQGKGFKKILDKVKKIAKPLLIPTVLGVLNKTTEIVISEELLKNLRDSSLDEYAEQIKNKKELKKHLKKLANKVKEKTGHPLIFIIDELDRCRPTFAIELLERVKHIFDIPNMIFVFGINRSELYSALQSIYGKIDANVYFRRFFDMEFLLPEIDSELFCKSLIKKYKLNEFFSELSKNTNDNVHRNDFSMISGFFPVFCNQMGLSLRDIDYCVRSIVFVAKTIKEKHYMHPYLISMLIILRLKNPDLYLEFRDEKCYPCKVVDYIDEEISVNNRLPPFLNQLNFLESQLYYIHKFRLDHEGKDSSPLNQLILLINGELPTHPEYLSAMIKESNKERIDQIILFLKELLNNPLHYPLTINYIFSLIELTGRTVQE